MIVSISEARAHLSQLIKRVCDGEKIVITKNNLPIAELVMHQPESVRRLGLLQGQWEATDAILMGSKDEVEAMFYGDVTSR